MLWYLCSVLWVAFTSVSATPAPAAQALNSKVMVGYQGWFVSATDGTGLHWNHWSSTGQAPAPSTSATNTGLAFDLWPELTEYPVLYDTNLFYSNGKRAQLFSAYDAPTVDLHLKWMYQYGIDGLFLQRFVSELTDPATLKDRNKVLMNVRASAEKYNRTFAVMYDISGADPNTWNTTLINDWQWITQQGILNSPYYQHHNTRPVVCIWGLGFSGRTFKVNTALNLIHYFRNNLQTVPMGGVPYYWRTGDHDSDPGWMSVYQSFEILQPWAVGRYGDNTSFDSCLQNIAKPDVQYIKSNFHADYNPVIFPGFSWTNLQNSPSAFNQIPRQGGSFFSHQVAGVLTLSPLFVYVAMFDEVNEGTAIFKAVSNQTQTPVGAKFLYLNVDGGNVASDHYLTLAGKIYKGGALLQLRETTKPKRLG